ncbi:relaxase/mobilization nuclease domain-containing protein [Mucilaginibacter sp. PAMB04168]|uniref:relaxase/mobilization nuclease domain-containing protein n=1 Tax=Mucilaginibacter sp. PAMB04168 TaxID=3138567 RepID=UPI0031F630F8
MIVKILKNVSGFPAVRYNTDKVDRNTGELMKISGFGPLQAFQNLRPQDFINYLQMVSSVNTRIEKAQFHAVLSAKGKEYDKGQLTAIATLWMEEMGYGQQPYLAIFHKDTSNNHLHLVTTRIGKDGRKINSAYEYLRASASLNKVLGYDFALQYAFSTRAQFYLILESKGYMGSDFDEQKLEKHIAAYRPDKFRIGELKALLWAHKDAAGYRQLLESHYQVELVFHAAEGKAPYGYTILDHATKQVFKGSEVLSLKYLSAQIPEQTSAWELPLSNMESSGHETAAYIGPIWMADDIDDEAILGRNRHRKKQARTNTR